MANSKKKYLRIYPFQNTDLKNLPGEKWKAIPDFEGLYDISNYGRVKSLHRILIRSNGISLTVYERIIKSKLSVYTNKSINKPVYLLMVGLSKESKVYHFSVGRLVYLLFVKKFDASNNSIWITYKDGDARNVHSSNLVKTDISSKGLLSYQKGRHHKYAEKVVTQFDSKGKIIRHYESLSEAARKMKIRPEFISKAARGIWNIYQSCFWRFGRHTKNLDLDKLESRSEEVINYDLKRKLRIGKIDINNPPAFLNLSLESMNGEKWKDIPGVEGYYQVSNYGRVKAVRRFMFTNQHQLKSENIIRPKPNLKKGNKFSGGLSVSFRIVDKDYTFSISKLVYALFVKKINIKNRKIHVGYKDNNPLNLSYRNLFLKEANTKDE